MAEKKIQPKSPAASEPAAGSRKADRTGEKVTARKVASRKVARKVASRKVARKISAKKV